LIKRKMTAMLKYMLAPILYRYPPYGLQPAGLGVYLRHLLDRQLVPGDVAEIGCSVGGTAVIGSSIVRKYAPQKKYFCFDTFAGFVEGDFAADVLRGTPIGSRYRYSNNSLRLVRRILDFHGCSEVILVPGDIKELDERDLDRSYSVILVDVDLADPTYTALTKFYPRLNPGGIVLVDDCTDEPEQMWRAIVGYKRFCAEANLPERYEYGLGIIEKA
jgi:hypothetical protein